MPLYKETEYQFLVWYIGQPFVDSCRPQDIDDLARAARALASEESLRQIRQRGTRARARANWETAKGPWKPPR